MPGRTHDSLGRWLIVALLLLPIPSVLALADPQEAPQSGPPYRVGGEVTRPEKISGSPPVYTEVARRARVTGVVIVEAIIDEQGNVTNAKILKGLPMGLDKTALDAIQTWKFKPATLDGRPVSVYYTLTVNFQVEDSPPFGPRFREFLKAHPDFADALQSKRYEEAATLLDHWSSDQAVDEDVPLARCYLLLEQGRLDEAWQRAKDDRGSDPYEALTTVGIYASNKAKSDHVLSLQARAAIVDLGLQAETMAMAARPDGVEAITMKAVLLREKVGMTLDPEERQALAAESAELLELAEALQAKDRAPYKSDAPPQ